MWTEQSPFRVNTQQTVHNRLGLINFRSIRQRTHIPDGQDIVPYILKNLTGDEYKRAMEIVEEEEMIGQRNLRLQPGETFGEVAYYQVPTS